MAEINDIAQIANISVHNRMKKNSIAFKNAGLDWGKFWKGDKDHEISASEVDKIIVAPGSMEIAHSCGRKSTSTGVDGHMDLYDGETKICHLHWTSPYWETTNTFTVSDYDSETSPYAITVQDWNHGPGALGDVNITISLMAAKD
ncbi:aegerolysin type hemolysin [Trichoderma velutinum]